jgi:hypothetical protein
MIPSLELVRDSFAMQTNGGWMSQFWKSFLCLFCSCCFCSARADLDFFLADLIQMRNMQKIMRFVHSSCFASDAGVGIDTLLVFEKTTECHACLDEKRWVHFPVTNAPEKSSFWR